MQSPGEPKAEWQQNSQLQIFKVYSNRITEEIFSCILYVRIARGFEQLHKHISVIFVAPKLEAFTQARLFEVTLGTGSLQMEKTND